MAERLDMTALGELTLGELELIETHGGAPLSRLQSDSGPGGEGVYRVRFARALALVQLRRAARAAGAPDPDYADTDGMLLPETADGDDAGEVATTGESDPTPVGRRKRRA